MTFYFIILQYLKVTLLSNFYWLCSLLKLEQAAEIAELSISRAERDNEIKSMRREFANATLEANIEKEEIQKSLRCAELQLAQAMTGFFQEIISKCRFNFVR